MHRKPPGALSGDEKAVGLASAGGGEGGLSPRGRFKRGLQEVPMLMLLTLGEGCMAVHSFPPLPLGVLDTFHHEKVKKTIS